MHDASNDTMTVTLPATASKPAAKPEETAPAPGDLTEDELEALEEMSPARREKAIEMGARPWPAGA